jgi:sulfide:quinone oxidoreductase
MATTIVLGGGVGGLVPARELRKKLGREHRVILIDKEARHVF